MEQQRTRSFEGFSYDGGGLIPPPERLRKVLVVGAGVAGLQTARQLLKLGVQVLILEANDDVGGVWIRNYIGFGLQVPWRMYQFPEYPWPKDLQPSSEYPTGQEVQEYVRAYVRQYDLRRYIRFNCKLLRLRWCAAARQWDALYCDTLQEKFFKVAVDYAVICAGIYSQPYIPDYEGTDSYAGIQLHAKDFVDLSLARGRRVVIVGAGKTALDCVSSIIATNTATSVTLLFRQAHWPLPRRMLGTSVRRLLFNRAMTAMLPPYYTASSTANTASRVMAPLRKLFWRSMESVIGRQFRITEQMRPRVHLPADLFYGGQILDNTMDKLVRAEALITIKGEINRFVRNGVILQDGNFVAADLVLYCTGYLKTYDYLEGGIRTRLDLQKDGLYLYRNCLPYAVPHLAFIGSEVSTYNNILTHGLQALWLARVLSGRLQLPDPTAMAEDVRAQQRWRRAVMPAQRSRGSVLMTFMMQYHDQLLEDMGCQPRRKGLNVFAECFGAYTAEDYHELVSHDDTVLPAATAAAAAATSMTASGSAEDQLAAAGVPPTTSAAAAAGGSGGMAGPAAAGSAAAATPAVAPNQLLTADRRCFGACSRATMSAAASSCNGLEMAGEKAGPGSGDSGAVATGVTAGERALVAAARAAPPPHNCLGAAPWNRMPGRDAEPDPKDSPRETRRIASSSRATASTAWTPRAAAVATAPAAAPVWAQSDLHFRYAQAAGRRASAEMARAGKSGSRAGDGGSGGGGRRPASATATLKGLLHNGPGADDNDDDPPDLNLRMRDAAAAAPPSSHLSRRSPQPPPLQLPQKSPSVSLVIPSSTGSCGLVSCGGSGRLGGGGNGGGAASMYGISGGNSCTSLDLREHIGCLASSTAIDGVAAAPSAPVLGQVAFAPPTSPSRPSRHAGLPSPISCHSAHAMQAPPVQCTAEAYLYNRHCTSGHVSNHNHQQHHVRWSPLISEGPSGGSAAAAGAVRHLDDRAACSSRSATDVENRAAEPAPAARSLLQKGPRQSSGGDGGGGGGGRNDDGQRPPGGWPHCLYQTHPATGTTKPPPPLAPRQTLVPTCVASAPYDILSARPHDPIFGVGPQIGPSDDTLRRVTASGDGDGRELSYNEETKCPELVRRREGAAGADVTDASAGDGDGPPPAAASSSCMNCNGSCVPLVCSSDRSHRLSSGSRSHSTRESSSVIGGGGSRGSSNSSSKSCPNVRATAAAANPTEAASVRGNDDGDLVVATHGSGAAPPLPSTAATTSVAAAAVPLPPTPPTLWFGSLGGATPAVDSVFGSPGSSAVSLSLWHANSAASSQLGRLALGAPRVGGVVGGEGSRLLGRLAEAEQADSEDEAEDQEARAYSVTRDGSGAGAGAESGVASPSRARASGGGLSRRGSAGAGVAAVQGFSRVFVVGGGGGALFRDWRRVGSLGRSAEGMVTNTHTDGVGGGIGVGGGGTGGISGAWLSPGASSVGLYSTGSSGAQLHSPLSFAGGIAAVAAAIAGGVGSSGAAGQLFVRQPSRLSSCPTGDSVAASGLLEM